MKVVYDIFDFFCALKFDYSGGLGLRPQGPSQGPGRRCRRPLSCVRHGRDERPKKAPKKVPCAVLLHQLGIENHFPELAGNSTLTCRI